mgnify:CR=1 FL=1
MRGYAQREALCLLCVLALTHVLVVVKGREGMLIVASGSSVSVHLTQGAQRTGRFFEVRCGPHSRTLVGKLDTIDTLDTLCDFQ